MSRIVSTLFVTFFFTFFTFRVIMIKKGDFAMGNFQSVLKTLRKSFGLTQDELANKLEVSRSTIGMYESGSREPDYKTLGAIADFFNVNTDYLLGRTSATTIPPNNYSSDENVVEFLQKNPDYKVLIDAVCKVKKNDIDLVKQMLERFS